MTIAQREREIVHRIVRNENAIVPPIVQTESAIVHPIVKTERGIDPLAEMIAARESEKNLETMIADAIDQTAGTDEEIVLPTGMIAEGSETEL